VTLGGERRREGDEKSGGEWFHGPQAGIAGILFHFFDKSKQPATRRLRLPARIMWPRYFPAIL
jgi:hypothetical protein